MVRCLHLISMLTLQSLQSARTALKGGDYAGAIDALNTVLKANSTDGICYPLTL